MVRRPSWRLLDVARTYAVRIDDDTRGRIGNGEEARFELPVGEHVLDLRIDWTGSPELTVDIRAGSMMLVAVECRGGLLSRTGYLRLNATDP